MASIIRIKRSSVSGNPNTLAAGELAYSALTDNGSNGGDRLYIGIGSETAGNAANHYVVGGKYFTDMLDHSPGILTASSALIVDSSKKVDEFNVDNINLNGNTISSTNTNGDLTLAPIGTGKVFIGSAYSLPKIDGSSGYVITTNGSGVATFQAITASLSVSGGSTIDVSVPSANNITIGTKNITLGTSTLTNGSTTTDVAGLTSLVVDNIQINGNVISSMDTNGNVSIDPNGSGTVEVNGSRISGVATPTNDTDAANKAYVDNSVSGLTWKDSVNLLASGNIALTGSTGTLVIDGHSALVQAKTGYRLLLIGQSTAANNGIYVYTDDGTSYTLTRSEDADTYIELKGASVFIMEGTTYANTGWVQSNHYISSFASQTWTQFSGAGAYTAGDGLGQSGTTFSVKVATAGGIEIASDELKLKDTLAGSGLTISSGILSVGGTTDRITINTDTIDIASTYVGQTSIVTLGTITTGTWTADTIATTRGGTGLTSYATGDLLYASASNTLSKLTAGSDGKILQMNSSGVPVWGDVDGGTY